MKIQFKIIYVVIIYVVYPLILQAQQTNFWQPIFENLNTATHFYNQNAFIGGFGNAQFSTIDIDNDGRLDLIVFDRVGNVWLPFKNEAQSSNQTKYIYQPLWRDLFPEVEKWALLRDYNCDGLEDIICHSRNAIQAQIGISVYKASRDPQTNMLQFTLENPMLMYSHTNSISHISVASADIPCMDDIDGDGDLDILTFNDYGGYLEYFQNQSMERGYGCDSLLFEFADNCWGRFYESGMSEIIDLSPHVDSCANYRNWSPIVRHPGSTVTTFDYDNDGDKDLFLGDISFNNIAMLQNGGNAQIAYIDEQVTFFPNNTTAINLPVFPAAFFIDIDNDNKKDLIVAPNIEGSAANVDNVWYYKNVSMGDTAIFQFEGRNFLLESSLDFGALSHPVFTDLDGDGDLDLIVATASYYIGNNVFRKSLFAYEQIGIGHTSTYRLISDDYANLRQYNFDKMAPTFADLDGDGDNDIIIGLANGTLVYVQNIGTAQQANYTTPIPNYKGIDIGNAATPTLFDLDNDGDLDLVIGEMNGNLNYFENIGTSNMAQFSSTPTSDRFGYIDARVNGVEGYTAPLFFNWKGDIILFLGRENGDILIYNKIKNNLQGTFQLIENMPKVKEGKHSTIAVQQSLNADAIECFVGNVRGGLGAYTYNNPLIHIDEVWAPKNNIKVYPNPTQNQDIYIESAITIQHIEIINIQGNTILPFSKNEINNGLIQIKLLDNIAAGIYFLRMYAENGEMYIEKVVFL